MLLTGFIETFSFVQNKSSHPSSFLFILSELFISLDCVETFNQPHNKNYAPERL